MKTRTSIILAAFLVCATLVGPFAFAHDGDSRAFDRYSRYVESVERHLLRAARYARTGRWSLYYVRLEWALDDLKRARRFAPPSERRFVDARIRDLQRKLEIRSLPHRWNDDHARWGRDSDRHTAKSNHGAPSRKVSVRVYAAPRRSR